MVWGGLDSNQRPADYENARAQLADLRKCIEMHVGQHFGDSWLPVLTQPRSTSCGRVAAWTPAMNRADKELWVSTTSTFPRLSPSPLLWDEARSKRTRLGRSFRGGRDQCGG